MATRTEEVTTGTTKGTTNKGKHAFSGAGHIAGKDVKSLQAFITKFNNDWSMTAAAALAYNLQMAIVPIAIATLAILGLVIGTLSAQAYNQLESQVFNAIPGITSAHSVLNAALLQLKKSAGLLGTIAIVFAVFNGSRLFILMESCFDIIYRLLPRAPLRQNLIAIGMLLLFIVLIPIMVVAAAGPAFVLSYLKASPLGQIPYIGVIFTVGGILGGLLASWIFFQCIYIVVPNQPISWRRSWLGAVVAAVLLQIYLILFPLYATHFLTGYAGQALSLFILLIFFYYFAVILLLGAEVNAFFLEGLRATPSDLITLVHTTASKHAGDQPAANLEKDAKLAQAVADERLSAASISTDTGDKRPDVAPKAGITHEKSQDTTSGQPKRVSIKERLTHLLPRRKTQKLEQPHQPKDRSKIWTALEFTVGTVLVFLVELRRVRKRQRG
jgi:membrane protein